MLDRLVRSQQVRRVEEQVPAKVKNAQELI